MKVTEVKYSRRFNLGDYEGEEYTVTAQVEEDDVVMDTIVELKKTVLDAREANFSQEAAPSSTKKAKSQAKEKAAAPAESDEADEVDEEEEETEKITAKKAKKKVEEEETDEDDEDDEEEEAPAPKKKRKLKGSVYARSNQVHKEMFASTLNELHPKWSKNDKLKEKAKQASLDLDGEDFLDADGAVIPAFTAKLKKAMK